MDEETARLSGIPDEYLYQLANGSFVHRGMFTSFGPNANCTLDLCPVEWTVYQYRPSLPANIIFMILNAIALAVHVYLGVRWRSWSFMTFMILGCLFNVVGYAGRVLLWTNPWSFGGFMVQIVFVGSAPVFFSASIYVTLSRAIRFFSPEISRLPPRLFYWIFISADIICLVLQAAGGALSTVSSGVSQQGVDVAMAGLILQVIILGFFAGFLVDYMVRYVKLQRSRGLAHAMGRRQKLFFGGLSTAFVLILARCAFRVDELSEGYSDSDRITNETLFIILEGVVIYLATLALMVGHPGFGFRKPRSDGEPESGPEAEMSAKTTIASSDEMLASKERGRTSE